MATIFKNDYLTLLENDNDIPNTLYGIWKGFWHNDDEEPKHALDAAQNIIKKNRIKILISNCTKLETVDTSYQTYITETWYPMAYKNGLISEILINPEDFMGQVSLDLLLSDAKSITELILASVETKKEAQKLAIEILKKHTISNTY